MRFDDMIATLLAWPVAGDADRLRIWRQLIDLFGRRSPADATQVADGYAALRALRPMISADERRATVEQLCEATSPLALIQFFAEDADIARPLLTRVCLSERDWLALLPELSSAARGIVAARDDIAGYLAKRISDMSPPVPVEDDSLPSVDSEAETGGGQIRDLIDRISRFQSRQETTVAAGPAFTIEPDGGLRLADGVAIDAKLGRDPIGVDGQAIGAWRIGAPIENARLVVSSGTHRGEWRISATPLAGSIETLRYRGVMRRPRADETARPAAAAAPAAAPHALQQAVAALRQPLARMVESGVGQGGEGNGAHEAASDVVARGADLVNAIDVFESALAVTAESERLDASRVLGHLHAALSPLAEARGVTLTFRIASDLPAIDADPPSVERMFSRLIGTSLALARKGERLIVRLGLDREDGKRIALILTRPGRLTGLPDERLRDPEPIGSAIDAPLLAFGFALRLVEHLAGEFGGGLAIHDDRLRLSLPRRSSAAERRRG